MAQPTTHFVLPEVLEDWPYKRRLHPDHFKIKAVSDAWLESFGLFHPTRQKKYNACNFGLFASLGYPLLNESQLRTAHDLMRLFFALDDITDLQDGPGARRICDMVMDAIRKPEAPRKATEFSPEANEYKLGELARQFWSRAIRIASEPCQRRFIETFQLYVDCVVQEAKDRNKGYIHGIEDYMAYRRHSAGPYPGFAIIQQGMNLSDEVVEHPTLRELNVIAGDLIVFLNDMNSYNKEQLEDQEGHNIITVVMHERNVSLQEAFDWVGERHRELEKRFLALGAQLPRWGKNIDTQVEEYVDGLGYLVRAMYCWSFETPRYFGDKGVEVEKNKVVKLLPKQQQV